jgi:phage host-nuclease inhibitor protein Gam
LARPKKATVILGSIEECGEVMKRLLLATLTRERLENTQEQQRALVMQSFDSPIANAIEEEKELTAQLQQYYVTHLAEVEADGKRRSVQLAYGTMGRRWTPPALKPRNKSFTWAAIKALLRALNNSDRFFLPPKEPEINKELVKKDLSEEALAKCGLKLEQDEEFFIELDRTVSVP